jgi:serine/threonine protein kinase
MLASVRHKLSAQAGFTIMHRLQAQSDDFNIGGRYEVKDPPIGQGGMGVVYKAYDKVTRRYVALKTIWGSVNSTALALFEKEWSVLARLSHPNIVDILETGQFEEAGKRKPFFVMPLLPGVTLDYLIKKASQRLTVERTVDIMSQSCRGLQAAHDQGIVHRDIKPSNIFVMDDDSVKLIDFGVVHLTDMSTMTGMKGTLNYLAPELIDRKPPSILSDIFAIGVVCYEALTRRKPFERPTEDETVEAIRSYIPPPVSEINSAVNEALSRTVHKCMAKQAWHRFSSARECGDVLRKALRNEPIEYFDAARIQPRIERVKRAQSEGDYQFAKEILTELEAEGHIDLQISLLRMQLDQAIKQKTIRQLLESARTRIEEEEFPLALQKVQEVLEIDPQNVDAFHLKALIERQRNEKQIDNWYRLVQQHLENQLFSQARMGLEEILRINPAEAKAHSLLDQVDRQEKEANKVREEKEQLYQAALKCYQCGEVSTALDKLERLLALSRQSTRTPSPEKEAQYQSLYNQIRSEREAFRNGYAESRRYLEDKDFARALSLCSEFLGKNPSDPLFQALKLEVEERERQERSAAVADVDRRVDLETDLDRKINILKEAVESYPNEPHFKEALKLVRGRRDLLDSIVNRAQQYEEHSQLNEALGQWDILRNIYPQYPGLEAEAQRLRLKQQAQLRAESKSRWVRQIDQNLETGEYEKAQTAVREALAEFPGDRELASLEKLSVQAAEKRLEVQQYFSQGQKLLDSGSTLQAIDNFRKAVELDGRDRTLRGAFLGALLERARTQLNDDWRESQALIQEALKLDGSNPVCRSLFVQVQDRERQALVDACVLEARELQATGDLEGALNKVRQGLARYPRESRLSQLESTLLNSLDRPILERKDDRSPTPLISGGARNRLSADPVPEPAGLSAAGTAAAPAPHIQQETRKQSQPAQPAPAKQTQGLSNSASQTWKWGIIVAVPLLLAGIFVVYKQTTRTAPPAPPVATVLHANVPGVQFLLDGKAAESPVVLAPGQEHILEASRDGYQSGILKLNPVAGQPIAPIQFILSPLPARLQVLTDVQNATVTLGDQPAAAIQKGELILDQITPGEQTLTISAGSRQILQMALNVQSGELIHLPEPVAARNYLVAVASVLGTHAKVFASEELKGNMSGQEPQPISSQGMDVDINASASGFSLSNGQTLPLQPSKQPALIILVSARNEPPHAAPVKQSAHLKLISMPDDTEIIIDADPSRPASGTGLLSLTPGPHKVMMRRPHHEDSSPIQVNLHPGQTLLLSGDQFQLVEQGAFIFKINPPSATVIFQPSGQQSAPGRKVGGNETVWVRPGKYTMRIEATDFVTEEVEHEVKAGQSKDISKSLKSMVVEAPPAATPMAEKSAVFESTPWLRFGNWWTLKKDITGWLHVRQGMLDITIQRKTGLFNGNKKVEWTIDDRGADRIVYWIDRNKLHRVIYKEGASAAEQVKDLAIHSGDYKLVFEITTHHVIVSEAGGARLDTVDRTNPGVPLGKIGFKGEISVIARMQ